MKVAEFSTASTSAWITLLWPRWKASLWSTFPKLGLLFLERSRVLVLSLRTDFPWNWFHQFIFFFYIWLVSRSECLPGGGCCQWLRLISFNASFAASSSSHNVMGMLPVITTRVTPGVHGTVNG